MATWTDLGFSGCGAISDIALLDGVLYAASGNDDPVMEGVRQLDGASWVDISGDFGYYNVIAIAPHDGKLYISVDNEHIYRCDGTIPWTDIGVPHSGDYAQDLVSHDGVLYCGILGTGDVYRYDGGTTWTSVGPSLLYNLCNLFSFNGSLYATGIGDTCNVCRWITGTSWESMGQPGGPTASIGWPGSHKGICSYSDALCGASDNGHVYLHTGGTSWTDLGMVASPYQVSNVIEYAGDLYASVDYQARIYRYAGGTSWVLFASLRVFDSTNSAVHALLCEDDALYCAGYYSGHVYRLAEEVIVQPYVDNISPPDASTDVPLDAHVSFDVHGGSYIVDLTTAVVSINGVVVYDGAESPPEQNGHTVVVSAIDGGYHFDVVGPTPFLPSTVYTVSIDAEVD